MHQTQDTYSLTHFRQKTQEHLDRIAGAAVETITQNGEAAIPSGGSTVYGPRWAAGRIKASIPSTS